MPAAVPETRLGPFDACVFAAKAALASVAALLFYEHVLRLPGAIWAAVSAALVTQPGLHPSFKASSARCLANVIGAVFGSVLVVALGPTAPALGIGIVVTSLVCHFARLDDALRPANAAVAIVTLTSNDPHVWIGSLDRVLAVVAGCAVALAIGLLFDRVLARPLVAVRARLPHGE